MEAAWILVPLVLVGMAFLCFRMMRRCAGACTCVKSARD